MGKTRYGSNDRPIKVFNHGNMSRDFTYIDDGVIKVIDNPPFKIYNIHQFNFLISLKLLKLLLEKKQLKILCRCKMEM
jgi:nucleoside-diphosphate-sugar epimerase